MANVSSGIVLDANLLNLKEIDSSKIRPEVKDLMVEGESSAVSSSRFLRI